ncbi:hypothetical protein [Endozoicomonas sp. ALB091]|uniref:hypothetical protein n=1 Tax=Endozoicomonas sp. ALB091 TaxID=3403073 RepID=UPI003BB59B16
MIPPSSSLTSSFIAGAGQSPTEPNQPESISSDSVELKLSSDDDFYLLYVGSYTSPGTLKRETIEQLNKDHPGIFNGLENPDDLFNADPVKYQPLAKLIYDTDYRDLETILDPDIGEPCWSAQKMLYGEYQGDFYKFEGDYEGTQWVRVHSDKYQLMKKNKQFVAQLREFLFDQSMSNDDKVVNLQMLFPPVDQSGEDISADQLRENMDLLFRNTFKQAQQRAINSGFKP